VNQIDPDDSERLLLAEGRSIEEIYGESIAETKQTYVTEEVASG